jgi:hypothetical protein
MMCFAREFDAIAQGKGHSMLNEVLDVPLVRSELASSCLSALHQPRWFTTAGRRRCMGTGFVAVQCSASHTS